MHHFEDQQYTLFSGLFTFDNLRTTKQTIHAALIIKCVHAATNKNKPYMNIMQCVEYFVKNVAFDQNSFA